MFESIWMLISKDTKVPITLEKEKGSKKREKGQPAKQPSRGPPLHSLSLPHAQPSTGPARPSLPSLTDAAAPLVSTIKATSSSQKSRPRQLPAPVTVAPSIAPLNGN